MEPQQVQSLLHEALTADEIIVTSEGTHYKIIVVGEEIASLSRVKQQQAVYAPLMEHIKSGVLHAITIKAFTPEKWRREKLFN